MTRRCTGPRPRNVYCGSKIGGAAAVSDGIPFLEASVFLRCPCGYILTDVACPGCVEHQLLTARGVERLQDEADREVATVGKVESWPEHFEAAGAIETWVCPKCLRLFVHVDVTGQDVIVYQRESTGLPAGATGFDSELGPAREVIEMAVREQAGESPLAAAGGR